MQHAGSLASGPSDHLGSGACASRIVKVDRFSGFRAWGRAASAGGGTVAFQGYERRFHGADVAALQHPDPREGAVRADRSDACADVCLRADGLRRGPYRQCPADHRLRPAVPTAAPSLRRSACHVCPQRHGCGRQDQRPRGRARHHHPRTHRRDARRLSRRYPRPRRADGRGRERAGRAPALHRAPCDRPHHRDAHDHRRAGGQSGHAYVAEGHVLFDVPSMPDYGALSKRPLDEMESRRAGRGRPLQALAPGFRPVEALEARRAVMAFAGRHRRAGAAGLAHRVLGHVVEASGQDVRHPCRRSRPDLPPSRERGGPVALLLFDGRDGQCLAP